MAKFMMGVFKLGYKAKHNPETDRPIDMYFELASTKPKENKEMSIEEENEVLMKELTGE